jgi:hypothetical protein
MVRVDTVALDGTKLARPPTLTGAEPCERRDISDMAARPFRNGLFARRSPPGSR